MVDSLEAHRHLVRWVLENEGYIHPNIEIAHSKEKGYHVNVSNGKSIAAMTRIASCPMTATLSVLNAMDVNPFHCHGIPFPLGFIQSDPAIVQNFFLMEQYILGSKSWWAPYISSLPSPETCKELLFSTDDLAWIDGTNLKFALVKQTMQRQKMFAEGLATLKKLHWESAVRGLYHWELFQWAATMFGSRSFTSQVLADTPPADQARPISGHSEHGQRNQLIKLFADNFPVLLPLVDLLNYRPRSRVEWQARFSFVGLQVLDAFEDGQELLNNYGPRDNETLLLGYGFAIEDNPFDHFSVSIRVPPGSPLAESRTWTPETKSDGDHRCFIFCTEHPQAQSAKCLEFALFSYDLLDSLSVLGGNDREMQVMYSTQKTLMSEGLKTLGTFDDFRNVLGTIGQILQECQARETVLLKARLPESTVPTNQMQKFAQIYRSSQLQILQTAILLCRYILVRAKSSQMDDDKILRLITDSDSSTNPLAFVKMKTLLQCHSCITRPGELITVKELLALLKATDGLEASSCELANRLSSYRAEHVVKCQYALLLGGLQIVCAQGKSITSRLQDWFETLSQWYPPNDPNWSYVPQAGPYAPGEEPPPMLMTLLKEVENLSQYSIDIETPGRDGFAYTNTRSRNSSRSRSPRWLKPEVVCWGWNVMEEETIRVPVSISDADGMDSSGLTTLLYCPRR